MASHPRRLLPWMSHILHLCKEFFLHLVSCLSLCPLAVVTNTLVSQLIFEFYFFKPYDMNWFYFCSISLLFLSAAGRSNLIAGNACCLLFCCAGASYVVKVTYSNSGIGTYGVPVCFTLAYGTDSARKEFDIIRVMVCIVTWNFVEVCSKYLWSCVIMRLLGCYVIIRKLFISIYAVQWRPKSAYQRSCWKNRTFLS